ncbi:transcriptional regulator [Photobacterium aphoticum]|uniref:Transcriptional regulator n=1 Tax=Photobacterium aphoticum TaxID=754436 RepID=A0A090QRE5_9GAMM|nr:transcriptional regulator [Photobacterium aphoticum]
MKVTIKDVAKKANVSISTVSYAINGSDRISEETRERVLKVANELKYVANSNAKLLKQKKHRPSAYSSTHGSARFTVNW